MCVCVGDSQWFGGVNKPLYLYIVQVRVVNGVPPIGDYSFAKYNKVIIAPTSLTAAFL